MFGKFLTASILALVILENALCEEPAILKDYDGYQLIQIVPKSDAEVKIVGNLSNDLNEQFDFWKESGAIQKDASGPSSTEILVNAEQKERIFEHLKKHSIAADVRIENIGQILRDDALHSLRPEGISADSGSNFNLNEYHSHEEILNYLSFVAENNQEFVSLHNIGTSFQGRNLSYVKIGYPSNQTKNVFFIDAGIHAREWITTAVALHFINRLTTDKSLTSLLEEIDVYILPSLNPDGYEYSRKRDRLWRKSRTGPRGPKNCYGVDLNRNFPYYWAFSGVSHNPCSQVYCGPKELSEDESTALTNFLQNNNKTIKAYITLHAYGNLLLHPWGHIEHSYPDDIEDLYKAGNDAAKAIQEAGGPKFTVGAGPEILYELSGSSQDFAKSIGIKYTYLIELTDSINGFVIPKWEIQPIADQTAQGLFIFAEAIKKL